MVGPHSSLVGPWKFYSRALDFYSEVMGLYDRPMGFCAGDIGFSWWGHMLSRVGPPYLEVRILRKVIHYSTDEPTGFEITCIH